MRRALQAAVVLALALALSGCGLGGLVGKGPLPFTKGNGNGALTVTVLMPDAANLVPNSEVMVGDVTVGSVREIDFDHWHARLVLGLDAGTHLPANAVATIGQKSLLGAEYVELAPPTSTPARGVLQTGATIPLSRAGRYPETEEVLAALSTVLNGGGLAQVQTIAHELGVALTGRTGDVRSLIGQLGTTVHSLDAQRDRIVSALHSLDRIGGTFARSRGTLDDALHRLPRAVSLVSQERPDLDRLLAAMGTLSDHATRLETASRTSLLADLHQLRPAVQRLADAGGNLTTSLGDLVYPFPTDGVIRSGHGDYMNLFLTFDVTVGTVQRLWKTGTPVDGLLSGLTGQLAQGPATQRTNPFHLKRTVRGLLHPKPATPRPGANDGLGGVLGGLLSGGR